MRGIYLLEDGELVVDFSGEIVSEHLRFSSAAMECLMIYGVVNTLTQDALRGPEDLPVRRVRFLFEGRPARGGLSLARPRSMRRSSRAATGLEAAPPCPIMAEPDAAIGVFDSGVGGLTVVRQILERLPGESIVYLGDTARVPYGTKSPRTVIRYALNCARILMEQNVKLLVVACNTASSCALDALREKYDVPVVGVIEPGARAAAARSPQGHIGVIGTAATIASGAYPRAIAALLPAARVACQACPLLVPLAEEGWTEGDVPRAAACRYLGPLLEEGMDTIVLGCTHYPLLKPVIAEVAGEPVTLVDSAEENRGRRRGPARRTPAARARRRPRQRPLPGKRRPRGICAGRAAFPRRGARIGRMGRLLAATGDLEADAGNGRDARATDQNVDVLFPGLFDADGSRTDGGRTHGAIPAKPAHGHPPALRISRRRPRKGPPRVSAPAQRPARRQARKRSDDRGKWLFYRFEVYETPQVKADGMKQILRDAMLEKYVRIVDATPMELRASIYDRDFAEIVFITPPSAAAKRTDLRRRCQHIAREAEETLLRAGIPEDKVVRARAEDQSDAKTVWEPDKNNGGTAAGTARRDARRKPGRSACRAKRHADARRHA